MHPEPPPPTTPFEVLGVSWTPVSGRLATLRRLVLVAVELPFALIVAAVLGATVSATAAGVFAAAAVVAFAASWILVGRRVRAWGYAQREDDLLIRSGLMFRELIVVPYGRMQFVDVTSGPLERRFGLAGVRLYTAAARTAFLPGLPADEAARLRDELAARGEAQAAGL